YTSLCTSQHYALLKMMSDIIRNEIKDEVLLSQFFGIILDETKDLAMKEQITVVLRYLFNGIIHEEFVGFIYAESVNAESLCKYITEHLCNLRIDIKACIGESYDGDSVMSGHLSGVQARVKKNMLKW